MRGLPIVLSDIYDEKFHLETFCRLLDSLGGCYDRISVSFVKNCPRQVKPDFERYQVEAFDCWLDPDANRKIDLVHRLKEIAAEAGKELTLCCSEDIRAKTGCQKTGCNSFD